MRTLSVMAVLLALALAAPAAGAPFGKPRTLGTTPSEYDYDSMSTAEGPGNGVAFYVAGEKHVGTTRTQRLFIARVEGNGRAHALTTTRLKGSTPARSYDGGPPHAYLAVGRGWRMLTTEKRAGAVFGIPDLFSVQLAPDGRPVAEQRLGPSSKASGILNTNARGDAIAAFGNGFTIARSAGRFAPAPKALRQVDDGLPVLGADGALYDLRGGDEGNLVVARSSGRSWGRAQRIFDAGMGRAAYYADLVTSESGDALLVYGIGTAFNSTNLLARWSRRGRPFGPPVELTAQVDPTRVTVEATAGGRFAVRWIDGNRGLHLVRASGHGRPFREVATWTPSEPVDYRTLLPLPDGRTLLAWSPEDRDFTDPDRLVAAEIDAQGRIGPEQTIAVGARAGDLDGFALRRLGANRAALVWTERRKGTKRWRIALTGR